MPSAADHIEEMLRRGYAFDHIVARGLAFGTPVPWRREDVLTVLRDNDWDLDPHGRLPVSKRVTSPLGLRKLPPGPLQVRPAAQRKAAAPKAAPVKRAPRKKAPARPRTDDVVATGRIVGVPIPGVHLRISGDGLATRINTPDPAARPSTPTPVARPAKPVPTKVAAAARRRGPAFRPIPHGTPRGYAAHYRRKELPVCQACKDAWNQSIRDKRAAKRTENAVAKARLSANRIATELDTWFADAQRSPSRAVQHAAAVAVSALMSLRIAVDDLARTERAAASPEQERTA